MPSSFESLHEETRELALLDRPPPDRPAARLTASLGTVLALVVIVILVAL